MDPKRRTLLLLLAFVATLAVAFGLRRNAGHTIEPEGIAPPGWWRMDAAAATSSGHEQAAEAAEAMARQLSLPYAAGVVRPDGRFGVRAWDRKQAAPGVNLYVSGHAAEATLMAMDGSVLHRWALPFERAFPGRVAAIDSFYFRRAALLSNGDLVAIYQGGGIVRLDARSAIVWARPAVPFNDLWISPQEDRILFIEKLANRQPDIHSGEPFLEDWIVTLDAAGDEVARTSIRSAFEHSPYRALLLPFGETADLLHTNTITELTGPVAAELPFRAGDWLISLREVDIVAVLRPETEQVLWARRGPFRHQHEPSFVADGRILLFDNLGGGRDRARILRIDPRNETGETLWPPAGGSLSSEQMGSVARLENGNLLVVESERGAAFEISPSGEVVWEFRSPHRAGPHGELVAVLADLVRVPVRTPFLERAAQGASGSPAQAP